MIGQPRSLDGSFGLDAVDTQEGGKAVAALPTDRPCYCSSLLAPSSNFPSPAGSASSSFWSGTGGLGGPGRKEGRPAGLWQTGLCPLSLLILVWADCQPTANGRDGRRRTIFALTPFSSLSRPSLVARPPRRRRRPHAPRPLLLLRRSRRRPHPVGRLPKGPSRVWGSERVRVGEVD